MVKLGLPVLGAVPLGLPSEEAEVDGVLYAGTLMSAISGVISAGTKQMDMLGCVIVGCITAMAGGTLRDVVLNRPPFWITYPSHLHAAVWGSLATFVLWPLIINHSAFKDTHLAFLWSDAIGMASSTVVGTEIGFAERGVQAAVTTGSSPPPGGIMRDVLCLDPPRALYAERSMCAAPRAIRRAILRGSSGAALREIFAGAIRRAARRNSPTGAHALLRRYATPALLGAATYAFLRQLNEDTILFPNLPIPDWVVASVPFILALALRARVDLPPRAAALGAQDRVLLLPKVRADRGEDGIGEEARGPGRRLTRG